MLAQAMLADLRLFEAAYEEFLATPSGLLRGTVATSGKRRNRAEGPGALLHHPSGRFKDALPAGLPCPSSVSPIQITGDSIRERQGPLFQASRFIH